MSVRLVTRDADATRALGRVAGARCVPGTVFCLSGMLGTGKTTFVQGLVEGLEATPDATSPTFTLIHPHRGRLLLYHVDLYRLTEPEVLALGLEEYLGGPAVAAVEWAEKLPERLRRGVWLRFAFGVAADERLVTIEDHTESGWERLLATARAPVARC